MITIALFISAVLGYYWIIFGVADWLNNKVNQKDRDIVSFLILVSIMFIVWAPMFFMPYLFLTLPVLNVLVLISMFTGMYQERKLEKRLDEEHKVRKEEDDKFWKELMS